MKELVKAWVDKDDTKIKEVYFRLKEFKNEGNTFVYNEYKLTDYLPDNISIGAFITILVNIGCLNDSVRVEERF